MNIQYRWYGTQFPFIICDWFLQRMIAINILVIHNSLTFNMKKNRKSSRKTILKGTYLSYRFKINSILYTLWKTWLTSHYFTLLTKWRILYNNILLCIFRLKKGESCFDFCGLDVFGNDIIRQWLVNEETAGASLGQR